MIWETYKEIERLLVKWKQQEAENLANLYLATNPYNIDAYMGLIDIFMNQKKYDKVNKILDFLIKSDKTFYQWTKAFFHYFKAIVLLESNNENNLFIYLKALSFINKAINIELKKFNRLNPEFARIKLIILFPIWEYQKWLNIVKKILFKDKVIIPEIIILWIEIAEELNNIDLIKKLVLLYETKYDEIQNYLTIVWEQEKIVEYNKIINLCRNNLVR